MKKDIKDMSVDEILERLGQLITPENVFYIIKEQMVQKEYEYIYTELKSQPVLGMVQLRNFLIQNEDKIDKEAMVLLILQNYLKAREKVDFNKKLMYESKIEDCKRLLENKSVSIYGAEENIEKGRTVEIIEVSSIEICAEDGWDNSKLFPEQKRINAQRKMRLERRNKEKKKIIERKEKRLNKIEKIMDLKNFIQFIHLDDVEDVLLDNSQIAGIIRNAVIRNALVNGLKLDNKELSKILKSDDLFNYTDKVEPSTYIEEFEKIFRKNIEFFDLDKVFLCAGYRIIENVAEGQIETKDFENVQIMLIQLLENIENRNVKLIGNVEKDKNGESVEIDYDITKLKRDINRFVDNDLFLTDQIIDETKEVLLKGDKNLRQFKLEILWQLGFEREEWYKLIKMSSENFVFFLTNCDPSQEDVKEVISEIKEITTECLYKLVERDSISQEEIVQICVEGKIKLEQLTELATIDLVEDNTIIDAFNTLKEQENSNLLSNELLLEYFNIEKLKEYINNNEVDEKFLEFYNNILPENEGEKKDLLNKINELTFDIEDKSIIIKFYNAKLIGKEKLVEKINDNDILELYENGNLDINIANQLNKDGIIEQDTMALIIDEEFKNGDILKGLENGIIDLSIALQLYPDKKVYGISKKYDEGVFKSPNPAIYAFMTSNMDIEDIDKLYKKGIVKEQDLKDIIMQGKISKAKITELYINMLISEEIIDALNKNQILTYSDTELMKKALGMKNIVKNMDKSLGIAFGSDGEIEIDEGIFLPEEKLGKTQREYDVEYFPNESKTKEPKKVISPAIRERKFEMYGAKRIKRNNVEYNEKSPFNDYEFYIIPDSQGNITPDCIVIAERYYEDKHSGEEKLIDGNATYLFELKDLTRISKKSKVEILSEMKEAKDKRMKRKLHTKNWSKNMDKAIEELLGRKLESCYSQKDIHDIRTISELIDGFKDKGETYRMFDVEFY